MLNKQDLVAQLTAADRFNKYRKDPSFCIITPTAYLDKYASQSNMHLVLAHLVDTDEQYAKFYRDRTEFKIMDNGAFELGKSYEPEKLLELAAECDADVIVLPDYPGQSPDLTIEAAMKYAPIFQEAGYRTMFVPQSGVGDVGGWEEAYLWATVDNPLIDIIGMSILGIPNAIPKVHKAFARVVMTERLVSQGVFAFDKPHHYLGLNSGPGLEIPTLLNMGALTSCDSSGPVWAGLLGHEYSLNTDSLLSTKKPSKHVDFAYPLTKDAHIHNIVQHNVDLTLALFD